MPYNACQRAQNILSVTFNGEYEASSHLLRSASGIIKTKIEDLFGEIILPQEREHQHSYESDDSSSLYKRTPDVQIIEHINPRVTVGNADIGKELESQADGLKE